MTITSFSELRQAILHETGLDPELFGERVTIEPEHNPAREISANVQRWQVQQQSQDTIDEMEMIHVRVGTDETNATVGGIADPRPGLLLWRSEDRDPDRRPFQFNGNVIARWPHKLILEFKRTKRSNQGAGVGYARNHTA